MLHMPPFLVGASKTYAQFVEHITGLATGGVKTFTSSTTGAVTGSYRTTATAISHQMAGSSWGISFTVDETYTSLYGSAILHGMPSADAFAYQVANGLQIFFSLNKPGVEIQLVTGLDRNGFESSGALSTGSDIAIAGMPELIYWDGGQAMRMTPNTSGGPTRYDW